MTMNFRMFNHVDYDDIIDDLYQNQLKTLCCVSFLYMLLRGLTYRSLLHSYFALIIFSFIQEYGVSYIKNDINNRFKKLFHKFITNKTLEEDSVEDSVEEDSVEDSVEEDSVEDSRVVHHVSHTDLMITFKKICHPSNANRIASPPLSPQSSDSVEDFVEDSVEEVSVEDSAEEVSVEEVSVEEVSVEEVSVEEVSVEEVSVEEVYNGSKDGVYNCSKDEGSVDSYTLRKRQILRDC